MNCMAVQTPVFQAHHIKCSVTVLIVKLRKCDHQDACCVCTEIYSNNSVFYICACTCVPESTYIGPAIVNCGYM